VKHEIAKGNGAKKIDQDNKGQQNNNNPVLESITSAKRK